MKAQDPIFGSPVLGYSAADTFPKWQLGERGVSDLKDVQFRFFFEIFFINLLINFLEKN